MDTEKKDKAQKRSVLLVATFAAFLVPFSIFASLARNKKPGDKN